MKTWIVTMLVAALAWTGAVSASRCGDASKPMQQKDAEEKIKPKPVEPGPVPQAAPVINPIYFPKPAVPLPLQR